MASRPNDEAFARCSAAARRANLLPATLRVWERRYGVTEPKRSPAGQRLYSENDVQRLKILKRVVDRGYAIGTVARLSTERLEMLAMATDSSLANDTPRPLLKWMIVGQALKERLAPLVFVMRNHVSHDDLAAALSMPEADSADIVIVHSPSLKEEHTRLILGWAALHPAARLAVVYSFGVAGAVSQLRDAGVHLLRDPLSRIQLQQALDELARATQQRAQRADSTQPKRMPRLFNDAALSLIERNTTAIACECPTHLTALISQLGAFETYSDECVSHDSRDDELHRHIGDVASQARSLLESLLQEVAAHEGRPIDLALMTAAK